MDVLERIPLSLRARVVELVNESSSRLTSEAYGAVSSGWVSSESQADAFARLRRGTRTTSLCGCGGISSARLHALPRATMTCADWRGVTAKKLFIGMQRASRAPRVKGDTWSIARTANHRKVFQNAVASYTPHYSDKPVAGEWSLLLPDPIFCFKNAVLAQAAKKWKDTRMVTRTELI